MVVGSREFTALEIKIYIEIFQLRISYLFPMIKAHDSTFGVEIYNVNIRSHMT